MHCVSVGRAHKCINKNYLPSRVVVNTINPVNIIYDIAKDAANLAKHGVSLVLAAQLEWDDALAWQDARKEYGEVRMVAFALLGERLYCVVFTDRGADRRIISLRKANNKEQVHYAKIFDAR